MTWHELLEQAIRDFGDTPGATLEQHLIDAHTDNPAAVAVAISKITQAHKAGKINSPWGAVRAELTKQLQVRRNMPANSERATRERNAEQWLRSAGVHFDRWPEIEDELFGPRGMLRDWHTDTSLKARIQDLWNTTQEAAA